MTLPVDIRTTSRTSVRRLEAALTAQWTGGVLRVRSPARFTKLEVKGYQRMRYELTPDAVDLGLGAALPAQLETGGHKGGFGRVERFRAYTFQISVTVLDGDGRSIVSRSSDVA